MWILYTLSYLDRANIGNAKVGGLETALGLTSTQYSVVLLVFFVRLIFLPADIGCMLNTISPFQVSYVVFEIPANMILTRVRPSI